jgi:hypothetical protein
MLTRRHPSRADHAKCCNLKAPPSGDWECPRHRCKACAAGSAEAETPGQGSAELLACRTCPVTYCAECLPEKAKHVGDSEISCEACVELLNSDLSQLQHELVKWDPEQFAQHANVAAGEGFATWSS